MARLKIEKTDEYEIHDIYKEFLVTGDEEEFKILKKNRTIRVLKKIDREGERTVYLELRGKEIGDFIKRLKPPMVVGRAIVRPVPYNWVNPNSSEDDTSESNVDDESLRILYVSEYDELLEGLDDTEYERG